MGHYREFAFADRRSRRVAVCDAATGVKRRFERRALGDVHWRDGQSQPRKGGFCFADRAFGLGRFDGVDDGNGIRQLFGGG